MNRTARDKNEKTPQPVKKIELDESKIKLRTVLFIIAIIVALTAFGFGLYSLLHRSSGWTKIEVEGGGANASYDLSFYYNVGKSGKDANGEYRALTALYGDVCLRAYQLFDEYSFVEGTRNLNYINRHPNEIIQIDEKLYSTLKYFAENGGRTLYAFPAFEYTEQIFYGEDESGRSEFDYKRSENAEEYIFELSSYFRSDGDVSLEFYDDCKIKLYVSSDYLGFLAERHIENVIGWGRFKNAVYVDYISEAIAEKEFYDGIISSYDGYSKVLGKTDEKYALNLYDKQKGFIGKMEYSDAFSTVYFRSFPVVLKDNDRIRVYSDGKVAHDYIDDYGFYRNSVDYFIAYSENSSCVEIALKAASAYIADEISDVVLEKLRSDGTGYAYLNEKTLIFVGNGMQTTLSEEYSIAE